MNERKAKPTPEDRRAAAELKARWVAAGRQPTQTEIGFALGITQGAVSQYLAGTIPMNYVTLALFCQQLGIADPAEIRTDLPEQQLMVREDSGIYALPSQPQRLAPETLRATHELLRGSYADQGKVYDLEAEPDLFAIVYERLDRLAGAPPKLAELVSIGRAIEERQKGVKDERADRSGSLGGPDQGKGKKRASG